MINMVTIMCQCVYICHVIPSLPIIKARWFKPSNGIFISVKSYCCQKRLFIRINIQCVQAEAARIATNFVSVLLIDVIILYMVWHIINNCNKTQIWRISDILLEHQSFHFFIITTKS